MKAYIYNNDIELYSYIVFADTADEAKSLVARAEGYAGETDGIEVRRNPRLDAYSDKYIPAVALLAAGWELECADCGEINSEDNGLPTYKGDKAYCGKCGAELDFAEDNILRKTPLKTGDEKK